ncbi:hypothetical protein [Paenibacillus senegalensis]|uniref:hypothetical protein n=1 Tax=Paenibacillus senegalensis TaxID=1465766 RepID=UPI0002880573|nr:hypothetical protein [Paenibacillus senegalensis]
MNRDTLRIISVVQLLLEIGIIAGYVIALIPFGYVWSSGWVLPLTVISFIIALFAKNNTGVFTGLNVGMALLSYIPVIGYVPRVVGIILSIINISQIRREL